MTPQIHIWEPGTPLPLAPDNTNTTYLALFIEGGGLQAIEPFTEESDLYDIAKEWNQSEEIDIAILTLTCEGDAQLAWNLNISDYL